MLLDRDRFSLFSASLLLCFTTLGQSMVSKAVANQILARTQTAQNLKAEADRLNQEGIRQYERGQFQEALATFQRVLVIRQRIGDYKGEEITFNNIGVVYDRLGEYPKALAIIRAIGDHSGEAATLKNIGGVYNSLGQYAKALDYYQQALSIYRALGDRSGEAATLTDIGTVYENQGEYSKALAYYQQALPIHREVANRPGEGKVLNKIGGVYDSLGEYSKAIDYYQQSLEISRKLQDRRDEGINLNDLGAVYDNQRKYFKALEFYRKALKIRQEVRDRLGEGKTLNNIGATYHSLGQYQKALEFYQQALKIRREVDDRLGESKTLNNIGAAYDKLGQYLKALEFYQKSLIISKESKNSPSEGTIINNIAYLLKNQNQTELAIFFFKQAVNIREKIRQDLQALPREQQESYIKTIADTYRSLADLLLQQDRVLEAQQVLDLLKVQELDDYLRNVRGTGQQLIILRPEQEILQKYNALQNSAIQLGQELSKLRKIPETTRSAAQQQKIAQLVQLQEELNKQFNQFIDSPDVVKLVNQLSREVKRQNLDLGDLDAFRDDLRRLNAVMLYPLILDDRLELVITTPDAAPLRRTVKVKREELNEVIAEFRSALQYRRDNVKVPAQKLYNWLIKPLEADLKQAKATTIIYAPDGQLRYIPLAALYDGNQWLVQNYRINNITAKSLTNFNNIHESKLKVLAGAFADIKLSYPVRIGQEEHSLRGLPFAGQEVANLAATISDTTKLLDKDFSLAAIKPRMNEFSIVHLATHAAFVPGQPEDSFILFGNGDRPTLRDIESWTLNNVDLVVLSGCETGIGGKFGNGEEILGLGYQFQNRGAKAAIASLWAVDDGGTQALMNAFYTILKRGNISKAEALRQAQITLITSNKNINGKQRGDSIEIEPISNKFPTNVSDRLSHPYYWAPFILIGNGL